MHSQDIPKKNTRWKHHNGIPYTVKCVANDHSHHPDYPITVVFQGDNGKIWAKTLDNFLAKMTPIKDPQTIKPF